TSPIEAIATVLQKPPAVLIIEFDVNDISSLEVCATLKRSGFKNPVLLIAPEKMRAKDQARCRQAGVDEIIIYGHNHSHMQEAIEGLIAGGAGRERPTFIAFRGAMGADAPSDESGRDESGVFHAIDDDYRLKAEVQDRLVDSLERAGTFGVDCVALMVKFMGLDEGIALNNEAASAAVETMRANFRRDDILVAWSETELVAVMTGTNRRGFESFLSRVRTKMLETVTSDALPPFRMGQAFLVAGETYSSDAILERLLRSFTECDILGFHVEVELAT
ncbi:MAG: hypothetical protein HKN20_15695, partial [Gemmatimonadetes bacterium]|nr:hypothetical protein [Gemmatimonadota bacterium]